MLVEFKCWKLLIWNDIILCIIKNEMKRIDYERIIENILCKKMIIELRFKN
jgi:hypothetical protein